MTEFNMQSFIREMGGMLDQHSLIDTIGDLMSEHFPTSSRAKNDEEGGGSTGGSIRRTKQ